MRKSVTWLDCSREEEEPDCFYLSPSEDCLLLESFGTTLIAGSIFMEPTPDSPQRQGRKRRGSIRIRRLAQPISAPSPKRLKSSNLDDEDLSALEDYINDETEE